MAELFSKKRFIIFTLVSFLSFQLIYGFLRPSVGSSDNWQPIGQYLSKFDVENTDSFLLNKVYPLISPDYRLNSDVGHYLELGRHFSPEYFKENPFLERPLYSFLIFLTSAPLLLFTEPSYGLVFVSAIFLNFILISVAVLLFFHLLRRLFSLKVAWLSSIFLIFSPFVHSYISQPLAEMLMAFAVVLAACLIYNYLQKPSKSKLIAFSLIIGILMLGKMFFAISLFILLMAAYFKRYKEGLVFLIIHLVPFSLWYLLTTKVWNITYYSLQVQGWDMGIWVFKMFSWPWQNIYRFWLDIPVDFTKALVYSFLLIPVIFSVVGLKSFKFKKIFYFGPILSVFLLGFFAKEFYLRHVFLLFPIVYPTAVLGIESAAKALGARKKWHSAVFYAILIGFVIAVSNINIYQIFEYNS